MKRVRSHVRMDDALDSNSCFALKNAMMSSSASLLPVSFIPGGSLNSAGMSCCGYGGNSVILVLDGSLCCMVGLGSLDIGCFRVFGSSSSSSWEESV